MEIILYCNCLDVLLYTAIDNSLHHKKIILAFTLNCRTLSTLKLYFINKNNKLSLLLCFYC